MIDKYRLDDLRLESGEKGELARWVIQLQRDLDYERRKVSAPTALAAMGAEPVAWVCAHGDEIEYNGHNQFSGGRQGLPLYTAPPAPVVPDERYQHLSELYHAQEKRLFKIAQRIKGPSFDKYAYSSSQAIDVLEEAIFGESAEEDCRAAMLQGAENPESRCTIQTAPALDSSPKIFESRCSSSPAIPDGWKLVPVEPTLEMIKSGANAASTGMLIPGMYRAMLAAAPQQEGK